MKETLLFAVTIFAVLATAVSAFFGSAEVASLRRETGDKSFLLRLLSFGRDGKEVDAKAHHHRHEVA